MSFYPVERGVNYRRVIEVLASGEHKVTISNHCETVLLSKSPSLQLSLVKVKKTFGIMVKRERIIEILHGDLLVRKVVVDYGDKWSYYDNGYYGKRCELIDRGEVACHGLVHLLSGVIYLFYGEGVFWEMAFGRLDGYATYLEEPRNEVRESVVRIGESLMF